LQITLKTRMRLSTRLDIAEAFALLVMVCGFGISGKVAAFSTISMPRSVTSTRCERFSILYSTEEGSESSEPEASSPEMVSPSVPTPPPPVPPKRMDPLMATLTRMDPATANAPTKNVPLFGEVPVDGGLTVLVPAAVIAVLGFIFSIVVAVNSQDELVRTFSQVTDGVSQQVAQQPNKAYDPNVCRGLCSSQEQDLEGLRAVMESLRK
jgi:hypothetical protein